nr:MAG TPA: hypothetical protein [Caudoviricetes sp.]
MAWHGAVLSGWARQARRGLLRTGESGFGLAGMVRHCKVWTARCGEVRQAR